MDENNYSLLWEQSSWDPPVNAFKSYADFKEVIKKEKAELESKQQKKNKNSNTESLYSSNFNNLVDSNDLTADGKLKYKDYYTKDLPVRSQEEFEEFLADIKSVSTTTAPEPNSATYKIQSRSLKRRGKWT